MTLFSAIPLALLVLSIGCGTHDKLVDDRDPDADDTGVVPTGDVCDDQEFCDGVDNDCDGLVDDEDDYVYDDTFWYADADGDGYGEYATQVVACTAPEGYASHSGDCDEQDRLVHPGAEEVCDGLDNDCDDLLDAEDSSLVDVPWYFDDDADGYGAGEAWHLFACDPEGMSTLEGDCDDANPGANPGAEEVCDGVDNDCDGLTDAEDGPVCAGARGQVDRDRQLPKFPAFLRHGHPAISPSRSRSSRPLRPLGPLVPRGGHNA